MAAIDKLYVHSYQEYDDVRKWALVYYPNLLLFFYETFFDWREHEKIKKEWVAKTRKAFDNDYKKLGDFDTIDTAVHNLVTKHGYNYRDAVREATAIIEHYNMTKEEIEDSWSFPIMCTPFSVDRKLKWICPVPCVRDYLHKQCGVNPKWEWLYRIFWKGKKYF